MAVLKELSKTNVLKPTLLCASVFLDRCSLDKSGMGQALDEDLAGIKDQEQLAVLKELFKTNVLKPTLSRASDLMEHWTKNEFG